MKNGKIYHGYEGLYQASNLGRIKSLGRTWVSANGSVKKHKEIIMKQRKQRNGYLLIKLCKNGIEKHMSVHRIIAETFINNPQNKSQVNHKNAIKIDNRVENLEWVTMSENIQHAYKNNLINLEYQKKHMKKIGSMQKGEKNNNWKGYINIYDDNNKFITQCTTLNETINWIKNNTKYKTPSAGNICTYIKKEKKIYGFLFKYDKTKVFNNR